MVVSVMHMATSYKKSAITILVLFSCDIHYFLRQLTLLLIGLQVDDILETKLDRKFQLVMDKGTLDAIGLHPDGPVKR